MSEAESVTLLLTHGHPDHAALTERLRDRTGARVLGSGWAEAEPLREGDEIETDWGRLVAVETPGHTPDHLSFHWPQAGALFVGDLALGTGNTTWVAGYDHAVRDYLRSLDHVRTFDLDRLYPTHGPPIDDVAGRLDLFERHRRDRIRQVEAALRDRPGAEPTELIKPVYGSSIPPEYRRAAVESITAILAYLNGSSD